MTDRRPSVAVIGGGVAGLATAWRLEHPPTARDIRPEVTVIEAAPTVGGNLQTVKSTPGNPHHANFTVTPRLRSRPLDHLYRVL